MTSDPLQFNRGVGHYVDNETILVRQTHSLVFSDGFSARWFMDNLREIPSDAKLVDIGENGSGHTVLVFEAEREGET